VEKKENNKMKNLDWKKSTNNPLDDILNFMKNCEPKAVDEKEHLKNHIRFYQSFSDTLRRRYESYKNISLLNRFKFLFLGRKYERARN
jgi:hypothetical protein